MSNVADDVANFLQSKGIGSRSNPNSWGIATDLEPSSPDTMITIYNTGGSGPLHSDFVRYPTVQVRVRGSPFGNDAYSKIEQARNALLEGIFNGVWVMGDIISLGFDDKSRPIFVLNFRFQKEE